MLEYAYLAGTKKIVHISEAETGINSGCICPHCDDKLTAKNRAFEGRKKEFYFSHQNFKESRSCLMTQLHLAAQYYFLNLDTFVLPHFSFSYLNETLTQPPRKVWIETATKEYSLNDNQFFADVMLVTNIGNIYIEIAVTKKNSPEKNVFYKQNKLISLEYNLGSLRALPIQDALQEMISNSALVNWIYGWDEERLKQEREQIYAELVAVEEKKAKEQHEERQKLAEQEKHNLENEARRTVESAKHDATKRKRDKYLTIPSYCEKLTYSIEGKSFSENAEIIPRQKVIFDNVEEFISDKPDYFVLKANKRDRVIYLVFVYEFNYEPEVVKQLQGAVLIRNPASIKHSKKQCSWKWFQNPRLEREREKAKKKLIDKYHIEKNFNIQLSEIKSSFKSLAIEYGCSDLSDAKKYFSWRSELIKKGLFVPTDAKKNPSHPYIFKKNKRLSYLWVFQEWYFLVLTKFIEIVDGIRLFTLIDYDYVFHELAKNFPLHPEYLKYVNSPYAGRINSEYVDKTQIIKSCLKIFEPQYIRERSGGFDRIDKLSLTLEV